MQSFDPRDRRIAELESRYVERMLTTVATLRQQDRNALEFVAAALTSTLSGEPAPSLIPGQAHVMLATA